MCVRQAGVSGAPTWGNEKQGRGLGPGAEDEDEDGGQGGARGLGEWVGQGWNEGRVKFGDEDEVGLEWDWGQVEEGLGLGDGVELGVRTGSVSPTASVLTTHAWP